MFILISMDTLNCGSCMVNCVARVAIPWWDASALPFSRKINAYVEYGGWIFCKHLSGLDLSDVIHPAQNWMKVSMFTDSFDPAFIISTISLVDLQSVFLKNWLHFSRCNLFKLHFLPQNQTSMQFSHWILPFSRNLQPQLKHFDKSALLKKSTLANGEADTSNSSELISLPAIRWFPKVLFAFSATAFDMDGNDELNGLLVSVSVTVVTELAVVENSYCILNKKQC